MAFFPQALFDGKYLLSGDAFLEYYPLRTVAWGMLRHGELPLWTPYILSGYPLLSMAQVGLAYPLTWGYAFLPGHVAEQIYVLAPFLLVPIFAYFYLRELNRSTLASLLGALTFGYGGMMASPLANNGLLGNAVMWLPLILIAIERARHGKFLSCLLGATGAYAMSVLTGVGQGFFYVGVLAGIYALFLVFTSRIEGRTPWRAQLGSLRTWQPALVMSGAIFLSMGVSAFQILETARAARRSVRNTLSYEIFTQGSFPPVTLVRSFLSPALHFIDTTPYVLPVAAVLAIIAVWMRIRWKSPSDPRILFWLGTALIALVLMMGAYTPVYSIVYQVPILNWFRVPSRHTLEWTFALAVLAAYGWDALAQTLRKKRAASPQSTSFTRNAAIVLLAAGIVTGVFWWLRIQTIQSGGSTTYLLWKAVFVLLTAAALWRAALITKTSWRQPLSVGTLLLLCYVEPSALVYRWWGHAGMTANRFKTEGQATTYLKQFPPSENRVYTRAALAEQFGSPPRFDGANVSALAGLHNVAGYEPLILDRYSRALGGVGPDSVLRFSAPTPDDSLLTNRSHVLDILNTSFVVSYSNLAFLPDPHIADGDIFSDLRLPGEVQPKTTATLTSAPTECDSVLLVTSLANSVMTPQGAMIATVRIHTTQGIIERQIRAGIDTAEWAHDRPDVRGVIKHDLGPIFDRHQIDSPQSFPAYRYKTLLQLDQPQRVTEVEITNVTETVPLAIYLGSLVNSKTAADTSLGFRPADNWQPVYQKKETLILRNARVQPRAWLVTEAEAVDAEAALLLIRGESAKEFDPQRTALLEVHREDLPQLPGGLPSSTSSAHITRYGPNRLQIQTSAPSATILVVSEIFYPGWVASVDGRQTTIYSTDYLLRGVALPAGQHVVEMRYTAPAARNGGIISVFSLLVIASLGVYAWRKRAPAAR